MYVCVFHEEMSKHFSMPNIACPRRRDENGMENFTSPEKQVYRVPRRSAPSRWRSLLFWAIPFSWFASGSLKFVVFFCFEILFLFFQCFSPFSRRFATQGQILIFYTHRVSKVCKIATFAYFWHTRVYIIVYFRIWNRTEAQKENAKILKFRPNVRVFLGF